MNEVFVLCGLTLAQDGTETRGKDAVPLGWHTSPEQLCEYEEIQLLAAGTGIHSVSLTVLRDVRM